MNQHYLPPLAACSNLRKAVSSLRTTFPQTGKDASSWFVASQLKKTKQWHTTFSLRHLPSSLHAHHVSKHTRAARCSTSLEFYLSLSLPAQSIRPLRRPNLPVSVYALVARSTTRLSKQTRFNRSCLAVRCRNARRKGAKRALHKHARADLIHALNTRLCENVLGRTEERTYSFVEHAVRTVRVPVAARHLGERSICLDGHSFVFWHDKSRNVLLKGGGHVQEAERRSARLPLTPTPAELVKKRTKKKRQKKRAIDGLHLWNLDKASSEACPVSDDGAGFIKLKDWSWRSVTRRSNVRLAMRHQQ